MVSKKNADLAWLVGIEDQYGTRKIVAEVMHVQPDGELHGVGNYRSDPGHEFAAFRVSAYLGELNFDRGGSSGGKIWGLGHYFQPYTVEKIDDANNMVKVFRRVETGLRKANEAAGYVTDSDYLGYLLRIGNALGIKTFYVRNLRSARDMSGAWNRKVDAAGLQSWIQHVQHLAETKPAELSR